MSMMTSQISKFVDSSKTQKSIYFENKFFLQIKKFIHYKLTLPVLCISESCIEIKINLNFYFYTSLLFLKRFYEDL